jgi:hypothetical protein
MRSGKKNCHGLGSCGVEGGGGKAQQQPLRSIFQLISEGKKLNRNKSKKEKNVFASSFQNVSIEFLFLFNFNFFLRPSLHFLEEKVEHKKSQWQLAQTFLHVTHIKSSPFSRKSFFPVSVLCDWMLNLSWHRRSLDLNGFKEKLAVDCLVLARSWELFLMKKFLEIAAINGAKIHFYCHFESRKFKSISCSRRLMSPMYNLSISFLGSALFFSHSPLIAIDVRKTSKVLPLLLKIALWFLPFSLAISFYWLRTNEIFLLRRGSFISFFYCHGKLKAEERESVLDKHRVVTEKRY